MQTDPFAQGTDPAAGGGDGSPSEVETLKGENAKLREEKRQLTSKLLGAEHHLTPTEIELLAEKPVDKQAEIAAKLASERGTPPPAPADPPAGDPEPPATPPPPDPTQQQPGLGQVGSALGGAPVTTGPASWEDDMKRQVSAAGSVKELQEIQARFQRIARGDEQWSPPEGTQPSS